MNLISDVWLFFASKGFVLKGHSIFWTKTLKRINFNFFCCCSQEEKLLRYIPIFYPGTSFPEITFLSLFFFFLHFPKKKLFFCSQMSSWFHRIKENGTKTLFSEELQKKKLYSIFSQTILLKFVSNLNWLICEIAE